jgi:hypothetical protein
MTVEPTFLQLPAGPTFNVWRIEKLVPVPWPDFGGFCTGDSYIVFSAANSGPSQRVLQDIYVWVGSESTPDEYTIADIKASELETRFKGEPNRHREAQYHESDEFHRLFAPYGGIRYLTGGVESALATLRSASDVSLYQIKGQRNPVLLMVPPTGRSLNHGDAFVLTSGKKIILWIGKEANRAEKMKAAHVVDIFAGKFPRAERVRLENSATTAEFWELLGGPTPIAEASEAGQDGEVEAANVLKLFTVEEVNINLVAQGLAVKRGMLTSALRNTKTVFVIQKGQQVVVFLQKRTSADVKRDAVGIGITFLSFMGLPNWYPISVVQEGRRDDLLDVIFG